MFLAWRLTLAHHLDWWEQRIRRIAEKLGYPQAWLHEFIAYRGDPRMTIEEFWVRYVLLRMDAEKVLKPHMSEAEAHTFYTTHEYMLWRNLVHRRHSAWRRVLVTMRRNYGAMLEYGCGTAPISAWVHRHSGERWVLDKPWCVVEDLDSPHLRYARWRVGGAALVIGRFHTITAVDVFEHLPDPEKDARRLVERLDEGGYLHYNIHYNEQQNDLDLATKEQLDATARYLETTLRVVWQNGEYRVARKP